LTKLLPLLCTPAPAATLTSSESWSHHARQSAKKPKILFDDLPENIFDPPPAVPGRVREFSVRASPPPPAELVADRERELQEEAAARLARIGKKPILPSFGNSFFPTEDVVGPRPEAKTKPAKKPLSAACVTVMEPVLAEAPAIQTSPASSPESEKQVISELPQNLFGDLGPSTRAAAPAKGSTRTDLHKSAPVKSSSPAVDLFAEGPGLSAPSLLSKPRANLFGDPDALPSGVQNQRAGKPPRPRKENAGESGS
jgi:hypothetical protein